MRAARSSIALFLVFIAGFCYAQEPQRSAGAPRRVLVSVQGQQGDAYSPVDLLILEKSLALALRESSEELHVVESGKSGFPASTAQRSEAARAMGADCWLWVGISGSRDSPSFAVQSFDLLRNAMSFEQSIPQEGPIVLSGARSAAMDQIARLMLENYGVARTAASPEPGQTDQAPQNPTSAILRIHARPGTAITGLQAEKIKVGLDGVAVVAVDAPASYIIVARLSGYYPAQRSFYVDSSRDVEMSQEPASLWSLEASSFNSFFPAIDASYFFVPNWAYVKLGLTSFLFGFRLDDNAVIYSFPLIDFTLQAGCYLAPEDSVLRPYASAGAFIRFIFPPDFTPRLDPVSPFGFQLTLGSEAQVTMKLRLFLELVPMLYLSRHTDLFLASLGRSTAGGYLFMPWAVIGFSNLRFGLRWLL